MSLDKLSGGPTGAAGPTGVTGVTGPTGASTPIASLPGYCALLHSTAGKTATDTATAMSMFTTTYDIPADTCVAGDVFEMEAWGTYLNNSGADRAMVWTALGDAVDFGTQLMNLSSVITTSATARPFHLRWVGRVDTTGASGVFKCMFDCWLENIAAAADGFLTGTTTSRKFHAKPTLTSAAISTQQAITLDLKGLMSANSVQTLTCAGSFIRKSNAP